MLLIIQTFCALSAVDKQQLENCFTQSTQIVLHPLSNMITVIFDYSNQEQCYQIPHGVQFSFSFDNSVDSFKFIQKDFKYGSTNQVNFVCASCNFFKDTEKAEFSMESQIHYVNVIVGAVSKVYGEQWDCFDTDRNYLTINADYIEFYTFLNGKCLISDQVLSIFMVNKFYEENFTEFNQNLPFQLISSNSTMFVFQSSKIGVGINLLQKSLQWSYTTLNYDSFQKMMKFHIYNFTGIDPTTIQQYSIIVTPQGPYCQIVTNPIASATNQLLESTTKTEIVFQLFPFYESEMHDFHLSITYGVPSFVPFENVTQTYNCINFQTVNCQEQFQSIIGLKGKRFNLQVGYQFITEVDGEVTETFKYIKAVDSVSVSCIQDSGALFTDQMILTLSHSCKYDNINYTFSFISNVAHNVTFTSKFENQIIVNTSLIDDYKSISPNQYLTISLNSIIVDVAIISSFSVDLNSQYDVTAFILIGTAFITTLIIIIIYEIMIRCINKSRINLMKKVKIIAESDGLV